MEPTNNYVPASEYRALKSENEKLKQRNSNLYRDCVSFAKLIKAGGKKDEKIEELLEEIQNLKGQIEALKMQDSYQMVASPNETNSSQEEFEEVYSDNQTETVAYDPNKVQYITEDEFTPDEEQIPGKKKKQKKDKDKKKGGPRAFFKAFICILFITSLLVSIISGVSYLFSTKYKDYTVGGYRFCTVYNGAMSPQVTKDDVLLVKYCGFDGLEINSLVVTTLNTRSVAKITDLAVSDKESVATVEDKNGPYEVSEKEFIGKVNMKIPGIGKVVRYACANPYNYFAIVLSVTFILLAAFLLIPSGKNRKPKFGKDYTVEDFTI